MLASTRKAASALLVLALVGTAYLVALDSNALPYSVGGRSTRPSSSSQLSAGFGAIRISLISLNDSTPATSRFQVTIRHSESPPNYPVLLYAVPDGPIVSLLPANESYVVEVITPLLTVTARVGIVEQELANLTITINQVTRSSTNLEFEDPNSVGVVSPWNELFVRVRPIATPAADWNSTTLLLNFKLSPVAPYTEVGFIQAERVAVSLVSSLDTGSWQIMKLRPSAPLPTTGFSDAVFFAFGSSYKLNYVILG